MAGSFFSARTIFRGACFALVMALAGCEKKGGEAIVLSKEYIPAVPADQPVADERQTSHERWRIKVEMRADLRKVDVLVEPAEWQKLQVGDRVNVAYSQGKYTGTVWSSELK